MDSKIRPHKKTPISLIAFFSFLLFFVIFIGSASAGKSDNVFGWLWSDNIGWISLNNCSDPATCSGPDYGVKINENTNVVSGHAWSSNIGWITFDANNWTDTKDACPPGGCFSGGNQFGINGWARAINGKYTPHPSDGRDNRGGYDGWISLGGSNYGLDIDTTKDLSSTLSNFTNQVVRPITGYAWGSNVIGWISANSNYHKAYVAFGKKCDPKVDPSCVKKGNLSLSVNGKKSVSIVGGDTINIDWSTQNGFYPTSCTKSSGGSTPPYPDIAWTGTDTIKTYQQQSGSYNSIHVPPSGTTTFRLDCTDGTDVFYDEVEIIASLTADIQGSSCVKSSTNPPPTITWSSNDPSPKCVITADSFYAEFPSYNIPASGYLNTAGKAPYTVTDNNYQYKDTFYKINCENGDSSYLATVGPVTSFVKMCSNTADYGIVNDGDVCNYVTEVKNSNPVTYKSQKIELSLTPNNFNADVDVSLDTSRSTPVGNFSLSKSLFKYSGSKYNTIDADWSLTSSELSKIINSSGFNGKNIQSIDLEVVGQSQNTTPKRHTLYYCVKVPPNCSVDPTDPDCTPPPCTDPNDPSCAPCDPAVDPFCTPTPKIKPKYRPF